MNIHEWAALLDGREYREELSSDEEKRAKRDKVLVIFGASDDLIEFRGLFDDEAGCYDGGKILVTNKKLFDEHECDCDYCGYKEAIKNAVMIDAKWDHNGYSWFIETCVPHATFDILEEGEKYCRGIVIDEQDLIQKVQA